MIFSTSRLSSLMLKLSFSALRRQILSHELLFSRPEIKIETNPEREREKMNSGRTEEGKQAYKCE